MLTRRRSAEVNKPLCRLSQPIVSTNVCRRDATQQTANANRQLDGLPTQCQRRPSIRPADATHCRHDPVPTRTVAVRCDALPLTQVRDPFCSLSRRSHNSTSFVKCQLASRQKSAVNHTLILEEIQIEFSSHFTSLPYESVRATSNAIRIPYRRHHVINESPCPDRLCHK